MRLGKFAVVLCMAWALPAQAQDRPMRSKVGIGVFTALGAGCLLTAALLAVSVAGDADRLGGENLSAYKMDQAAPHLQGELRGFHDRLLAAEIIGPSSAVFFAVAILSAAFDTGSGGGDWSRAPAPRRGAIVLAPAFLPAGGGVALAGRF